MAALIPHRGPSFCATAAAGLLNVASCDVDGIKAAADRKLGAGSVRNAGTRFFAGTSGSSVLVLPAHSGNEGRFFAGTSASSFFFTHEVSANQTFTGRPADVRVSMVALGSSGGEWATLCVLGTLIAAGTTWVVVTAVAGNQPWLS